MATRGYILLAISLLLLSLLPIISHSKAYATPFGFIRSLEGCRKGQKVNGLHQLKSYLAKFGYLEYHPAQQSEVKTLVGEHELFDESLENAIRTYQRNYRLSVTGHLDADTVRQMMKPRCGLPDVINGTNTMRPKGETSYKNRKSIYGTSFYVITGRRWPSSEYQLTYQILAETLVPGAENMRSIVTDALGKWAQYSPFDFQEVAEGSESNLVFGFFRGDHGDEFPFDGPGGVLAHSFYPTDGRSHYDATENWSDNPGQDQIDLDSVVLHEIGHILGLAHSEVPEAVMHSGIAAGERKRDLQEDDIEGIHALYGSS